MPERTPLRRRTLRTLLAVGCLAFCGCASVAEIRIENVSPHDFYAVRVADQSFGRIAVGETTDYRDVKLKFRYAAMEMLIAGRRVTAQSLNFGARRFTYRIAIKDLSKGHLAIKMVRDREPSPAKQGE